MPDVDPHDLGLLLLRYWRDVEPSDRALLLRDLGEAIRRGDLGDACDEETWRGLLAWMDPPSWEQRAAQEWVVTRSGRSLHVVAALRTAPNASGWAWVETECGMSGVLVHLADGHQRPRCRRCAAAVGVPS